MIPLYNLIYYTNVDFFTKEKPLGNSDVAFDCEKYVDQEEKITKLIDAPFDASLENNTFTVRDFFIGIIS